MPGDPRFFVIIPTNPPAGGKWRLIFLFPSPLSPELVEGLMRRD